MVNNQLPQKSISYDAGKITVNVFTVVSIVGFFVGITYLGVNERQRIRDEFRQEIKLALGDIKSMIEEHVNGIEKRDNILADLVAKNAEAIRKEEEEHLRVHKPEVDALRERLQHLYETQLYILENMITKGGYSVWCYELQLKNKEFVCPDYETLKRFGLDGTEEKRFHKREYGPPHEPK